MSTLPEDLVALVHHVQLSEAGWRNRAIELIALSVIDQAGKVDSDEQLAELINASLPAPLGHAQIQEVLRALQSDDRVLEGPAGELRLSDSVRAELDVNRQEGLRREEEVKGRWGEHISELHPTAQVPWENLRDDLLVPLVGELGAETYELLSGEPVSVEKARAYRDFLTRVPEEHRPALGNRITSFIDPQHRSVRDYVLRLLNTAFLVQATGMKDSVLESLLARTGRALRMKVFVDTNFLFSLIGLHDNPADDVVSALHDLIARLHERVDVRLYLLPITIDEARRTIAAYESRLDGFYLSRNIAEAARDGTSDLSGITLKFIEEAIKAGKKRLSSKEYFGTYHDNLLQIARDRGVELYNEPTDPLRTEQTVLDDVADQEEFLSRTRPEGRQKGYENILHDMVLWHFTKRKRPTRVDSPIDSEFWVATIDFSLLGFDRHKRRRQKDAPPVCIHPTVLLQLLQLWVPREDHLEAAMMNSIQPLLPHAFDPDAEKLTIRILRTLSRFRDADAMGTSTVTNILLDDAVRTRVGAAKSVEQEVEIISSALAEENRRLELKAKQLDRERQGLTREVKETSAEVRTLQEELEERQQENVRLGEGLEGERTRRKQLEARLEALEQRSARRSAWGIATAIGAGAGGGMAVGGLLLARAPWIAAQSPVWLGHLVIGLFFVGGVLAGVSLASTRLEAIRESGVSRTIRRITKWYWVVLVLGSLVETMREVTMGLLFADGGNGA